MSSPRAEAPIHPEPDPGGYQPLVVVLLAACGGIGLDRYAPPSPVFWFMVTPLALLAWVASFRTDRLRLSSLSLLVAVAALGGLWHHLRWNDFSRDELGFSATTQGAPICLEGIAIEAPRVIPADPFDPMRPLPAYDRSQFHLQVSRVRNGANWQKSDGLTTVSVQGHVLGLRAGNHVRIFGRLRAASPAMNPGEYDWRAHQRADRILCQVTTSYPDAVERLPLPRERSLMIAVDDVRQRSNRLLGRYLTRGNSALASSLLLGLRRQVEPQQTEAFLTTGTLHLLAISGLHVGMLAVGWFYLLRLGLLPRSLVLTLIVLLAAGYALLTDARPPVVRATLMVGLACLALGLGRRPRPFNVLAAAALVVLAWNPADLFRAGPQLSFLAAATIAWMVPWLRRPVLRDPLERLIAQSRPPYEKAVREFGWRCWQMTLMSAAIWAISAPLVMARFHVAAPIALLLNVPLGLPVAVSLLSGFGVMLFGSWLSPVAHLCAIVCDASLALLQTIVEKAQGISWGHAWVTGPAEWWLAGFYLLILGFMLLGRWCPPRRWCVAWVALWIATGVGTRWIAPKDETLCCTFVSVGHGLAVLIELPDGRAMLYDAGQLASPRWSARAISEVLWSRGITHLDAVVVSHADVDHYNGLPTLLDRFSVGAVYTSTVMFTEESGALIALRDALAGQEIPIRELSASDRFELSEGDIQVWHPPAQGLLASDNANSIVLAIEYRGRRILLTGDLESPGLEMVMSEEPYDCDLVLAPHHGSRRSNSAELARWCTPEWVVVSGPEEENGTLLQQAYQQAYQQPHQGAAGDAEPGQGESRARSVRVLYTTRHGAITARIGPQGQFDVDWFRR